MTAKLELAEFVEDHVARHASLVTAALGTACVGLANIGAAYGDAQARLGNWNTMLENIRSGCQALESALPVLRSDGGPGVAMLIEMGEREMRFGRLLEDEIVRLAAGESTLA